MCFSYDVAQLYNNLFSCSLFNCFFDFFNPEICFVKLKSKVKLLYILVHLYNSFFV